MVYFIVLTFFQDVPSGGIAQSVEQRTENPCVGSSILPPATLFYFFPDNDPNLPAQIGVDQRLGKPASTRFTALEYSWMDILSPTGISSAIGKLQLV